MRRRYAVYSTCFLLAFCGLLLDPAYGQQQGDYAPGEVIIKFRPDVVILPAGRTEASIQEGTVTDTAVANLNQQVGVTYVEKVFPNFKSADTLATDRSGRLVILIDMSRVFKLLVPPTTDIRAVAKQYDRLSAVEYAEPNGFYNVSLSGAILKEYGAPSHPFGLAYDGQNLWLADGTGMGSILKLTRSGNVLCEFSVPTDFPGGLTWSADKLWLAEYEGSNPRLFGIDPDASCRAGSAVITDTLRTPGGGSWGLAWDGTHLLVASDKLYKLTTKGVVVSRYDLPVFEARDITWDGKNVWILNYGPKDIWNLEPIFTQRYDPVISAFKLR